VVAELKLLQGNKRDFEFMGESVERSSVSVIIPVRNDRSQLLVLLDALDSLKVLPYELVIVDSSDDTNSYSLVHEKLESGRTPYVYKQITGSYAGRSMNIGADLAQGNYLAFLDTKTIPNRFWLSSHTAQLQCSTLDLVFGKTLFAGKNYFQKLIKAASYGNIPHETVPGTVISQLAWNKVSGFSESVRSTYDVEWRNKAKKILKYSNADDACITYTAFPPDILTATKKYILYSFHTARTQAKDHIKQLYLSILLIVLAVLIPRWNYIIPGWESNPLYIPHVTKIFLLAIVFLFIALIGVERLFVVSRNNSILKQSFKWVIFVFVSLGVYSWNQVVAGWVETATYYVPHITKMYLVLAGTSYMLATGVISPIRKKESVSYLFPYNWIMVGLLRLYLDVIKAPGYILGAVICIFRMNRG